MNINNKDDQRIQYNLRINKVMSCMNGYKLIIIGLGFFCNTCFTTLHAQDLNIVNDTIYVNRQAEIHVEFPTNPTGMNLDPVDGPYNLHIEGSSLVLIGKQENSKPATVRISEGGRTHHFWLMFKKEIDFNDAEALYKDYSTLDKLRAHVEDLKKRRAATPKSPVVSNTNSSENSPATPVLPSGEEKKYQAIVKEAGNYFGLKKYAKAKEIYKQALAIRPGDAFAIHQLDLIARLETPEVPVDDQVKLKNLYLSYIAQGEKAYRDGQLSEARAFFEEALSVQPDGASAKSYLKIIEEKERGQKEADDRKSNYNASIQLANTLLQAGDLVGAKDEYTRAIGFDRQPFALSQLKMIEGKLIELEANERREKLARDQQLKEENQKKEALEREDNYQAAIHAADGFFKAGDYENAKTEYNKALDFFKRDWPKNQINEIDKIKRDQAKKEDEKRRLEEQQELEHKYDAAMEGAERYFKAEDYTNAKIMYNRAMSLIARQVPQDRIKEINKILEKKAKELADQKIKEAQEKAINQRYEIIISNANTEFDKKNYAKAKTLYGQASVLKSSEAFPKNRMDTIADIFARNAAETKAKNDSIAKAKDVNRKFQVAMSKGKSSFQKADFLNAKVFYTDATNLKPLDPDAQKQLEAVTNKIDDIEKETALNNSYNHFMGLGDSQRIAKSYEAAVVSYNEALKLKPLESDPKVRIKFVEYNIAEEERRKQLIRQQELEAEYRSYVKQADKAVADFRFEDARSQYTLARTIHPENDYVKERLSRIVFQLEKKAREDSIRQASLKKEEVPIKKKSKRRKSTPKEAPPVVAPEPAKPAVNSQVLQATSITYTATELSSKYPGIDFSSLPADQPINSLPTSSRKTVSFFDSLTAKSPRLNLASEVQGVKMTIENIDFEGSLVHLKIRISNNSAVDFLTGVMMFTWTKQTGNHIKLYPSQIFPSILPVIKPGYEMKVVYTCKTYNILDKDMMTFELTDRLKKVKLSVDIPGSTYNNELINLNKR